MDAVNKLAAEINYDQSEWRSWGSHGRPGRARGRRQRQHHHHQRRVGRGLAAGQTFTVYHKGKEIKDPSTGEVLDVQTTPIGQLTITTVRERIAMGNFNGAGKPVVGDVVRK